MIDAHSHDDSAHLCAINHQQLGFIISVFCLYFAKVFVKDNW